ncbi:hypothetical protein niasHT_014944 [Heterodera trifolii]|uniref:Uncharacterized protein n=1 Tax=Heterodera trifolii TaxID=157864 RepID=A0ABD2LG13_9BILA
MAFKLQFVFIASVMCVALLLIVQMPGQTDAAVAVRPAVRRAVKLANTPAGQVALAFVPGAGPAARVAKHLVH